MKLRGLPGVGSVRYRTNKFTKVEPMTHRTANYRGYSIEGSVNRGGWSVEVHSRGSEFPILSRSTFRVRHPSWTSAVAEATSRVDALLDNEPDPEPNLTAPLLQVFEAAWEIVGTTPGAGLRR